MQIVRPTMEHLESFIAALEAGWSPQSTRPDAAAETLAAVRADPQSFLADQFDPEGRRAPFRLPDGSLQPAIPEYRYWLWDGGFCGVVSLRWLPGTTALPENILGHVGYTVVPWKRGRGYATAAVRQILPVARAEGLPFVDLTTDPGNRASQAVILANGGVRVEAFTKSPAQGGGPALRFRIALDGPAGGTAVGVKG
ncbi:GNAT family N-acetyltransferase [Oxalobacteraceae bacterium OM1]|nr:GNAT family N-acetyltransferase [Oxalobacteraceae bacterium OM1]